MSDITVIRKKFWTVGVHEYGYELGKVRSTYYVKFLYPAAFYGHKEGNYLKLYKTLKMAEKKISNFVEQHPARSLAEVKASLAEMKSHRRK
jgi:hypothetical protein